MSRSATCMKDLVRQEISDYVDQKSNPLPQMSSGPLAATSPRSLHIPVIKGHGDSKSKLPLRVDINGNKLFQPIKTPTSPDNFGDSATYSQYERCLSQVNKDATSCLTDNSELRQCASSKLSPTSSISSASDEESESRSPTSPSPPLHPHPPSCKKDRHPSLLKRRHHKLATVS